MFRTVPLSIIRSFSLYTQQWYMSHNLRAGSGWNSVPSWSCSQAVSKPVWHIPLLCVQWKTPDDGQRNCPKHVEFCSKNKFEDLLHLVGFIIRTLSEVCQWNWSLVQSVTKTASIAISPILVCCFITSFRHYCHFPYSSDPTGLTHINFIHAHFPILPSSQHVSHSILLLCPLHEVH